MTGGGKTARGSAPRGVYVIGDSISIQYGPYLERALAGVCPYARKSGEAEARLNLDVPQGANGGDSARVRAFLESWATAPDVPRYDILLLNCGLHDIKGDPATGALQVPIEAYRANLPAIVAQGRRVADTFVWLRTTPVDDALHARRGCGFTRAQADVDRYNAVADEVMAAHGVPAIDLARFTAGLASEGPVFRDGVHFEPVVQARQGAYIGGWVAGWLAGGGRRAEVGGRRR